MVRKEFVVDEITKIMHDEERIRNVAIIAHVHHGKTTLTDSLLARAGLIAKSVSGDVLYTNYEAIEKDRRMTIKSANISLGFNYKEKDYIINLIDTPGHVDFGGHVTRAMKAVDGVVLVVDPVEGIMPQTETVLRQSLKERAQPVLFVNKVDRLISELRLSPEEVFKRLLKLVADINYMIEQYAPIEFAEKWKVSVEKGSVAFGSAYDKWAVSKRITEKYKVTFKDIFTHFDAQKIAELQNIAPIDEAVLAMIIDNLPSPKIAQVYRVPHIWHGDLTTEEGKNMLTGNAAGGANILVFGVSYDQHSGDIAIGRVFSGVVKKGTEFNISGKNNKQKVAQVGVYMGPERVLVEKIPSGNIVAMVGLKDVSIGDTLSENQIEPFEQITHYSKPVVTKAVEAKDSRDTTKLIEALRELSKNDFTIQTEINQETGEHLISGMGELHLEVIETKLRDEFNIPITTSEPIVVYNETIGEKCPEIVEGKTPNKHNKFYITVEPLPEGVVKAIEDGDIKEGKPKGQAGIEALIKAGLDRPIAKNVEDIYNRCVFADSTKGVQSMNDVMKLLTDGFRQAIKDGPLAREKCYGILVQVVDATIHEDPVHRGPSQIIPAIRNATYAAILMAKDYLMEPKQIITVNVPQEYMSTVISFLQGKRAMVNNVQQDRDQVELVAKIPVSEMIKGFSNDLRGLTQGRAVWAMEFAGYERLPAELQDKIVREIRKRKGQNPEPPTPQHFLDM